MAGSTKDVAFKYVVFGLLICVHYVNCGDPAGKFRLIEQLGAQLNWISKTIKYAIDFSIEFCSTVGYPVKLNGNLNRKCIQYPIEMSPSIVYNQEGREWQGFEIELGIRIASNP